MKVTFVLDRETKNTYRFAEVDETGELADREDQLVGTIYVKQNFFNGTKPETLTIDIEEATKPAAKKKTK